MDLPIKNPSPSKPRRGRRVCLLTSLCCLCTIVLVFLVLLILALTLFKIKDPTLTLTSITITGLSPSLSFPTFQLALNLTLDLQISVYNPNRASFAHAPGTTDIDYRGSRVGTADIAEGTIPSRGSAPVNVKVTLRSGNFTASIGNLTKDVLAGELEFDSSSRVPGKVKILGFIRKHAVAYADCRVVVGISDLQVRQQECSQKTKL